MTASIRAALVAAAALLAASCGHPAYAADPELGATAEAGQHDAGWIRVVCTGTTTDQRCHLRISDGFSRLDVNIVHGGTPWIESSSWTYLPRTYARPQRTSRRVVSGVRVDCHDRGSRTSCTVTLRQRVTEFRLTYWSAGWNEGGLTLTDIV